ncbi:MAG: hypothetical protein ACRD30_04510 [Bryobacteraceae bacterium]
MAIESILVILDSPLSIAARRNFRGPGLFLCAMWTEDLGTLGYLAPGGNARRAVGRFQRHAKRVYRKIASGQCFKETPAFAGVEDGIAGPETLAEIARWIEKGFRLPLGYFKMAVIETWGELRSDMAAAWLALIPRIAEMGGTISGPYGDTRRPLMNTISTGASKFSFHICGRAVDLNQGLGNSVYFPISEGATWRIYCKTADQNGSQGEKIEAGAIRYHNFYARKETPIPGGYYLDLTAAIERGELFERIDAQTGWENDARRSEWWHFQWVPAKQKTFQDECELAGIAEAELRAFGYRDADLDHVPG